MQIYILRHGIAEENAPGGDDAGRALTEEGKRKLRDVLKTAARAEVQPELILSSPFVRAVETAEIAMQALGYQGELYKTDLLVPSGDPEAVWEEIRQHRSLCSVMLVGHEPLLSRVLGHLLASLNLAIDLKKGALARVDTEEFGVHPRCVLKWLFVSKLA